MVLGLDDLVQLYHSWMIDQIQYLYLSLNDRLPGFVVHLCLLISLDGDAGVGVNVDGLVDGGVRALAEPGADLVVQQPPVRLLRLLRLVLRSLPRLQVVLDAHARLLRAHQVVHFPLVLVEVHQLLLGRRFLVARLGLLVG